MHRLFPRGSVELVDDVLTFLQQEGVDLAGILGAVGAHLQLGDAVGVVQVIGDHGLVVAQEFHKAVVWMEDPAEAVEDVDVAAAVDLADVIGVLQRHQGIPRLDIGVDGLRRAGGVAAAQTAEQAAQPGGAEVLAGAVDHKTGFADIDGGGDEPEIQNGQRRGHDDHINEQLAEISDFGPEGLEHAGFLVGMVEALRAEQGRVRDFGRAPVNVLKTYDVVFSQISPALHFDQHQIDHAGVFQAMAMTSRDIGGFVGQN